MRTRVPCAHAPTVGILDVPALFLAAVGGDSHPDFQEREPAGLFAFLHAVSVSQIEASGRGRGRDRGQIDVIAVGRREGMMRVAKPADGAGRPGASWLASPALLSSLPRTTLEAHEMTR